MILWRRMDVPGHEVAQISGRWRLTGTAIFLHDGQPAKLDYSVDCDPTWRTRSARVAGFVGLVPVHHGIEVDNGKWRLDGAGEPTVEGCIDVDLNFSPSTNLIPIRRCILGVGEEISVIAAWLRFPSFRLEPLVQRYRRTAEFKYQYESPSFKADLEVDADGFVLRYANIWARE
jgi:hypothetical protein